MKKEKLKQVTIIELAEDSPDFRILKQSILKY